jgi:uncharacterized protein (DUF427 family)
MDPNGHHLRFEAEPRRVEVSVDGVVLASSERALVLHETGLPHRHYFPLEDVRTEHLTPTETETVCPFKGRASYWSAEIDGTTHRDLAWTYVRPIESATAITELVCFFDERVDVTVDGDPVERPVTAWSE